MGCTGSYCLSSLGAIADIEATSRHHAALKPERGAVVHSNHVVSEELLPYDALRQEGLDGQELLANSTMRRGRLHELLAERGASIHAGERCNIAAGARVENSIIWDDVTIEDGAIVERAVLADGVHIRAGEVIENAAVVRGDLVRDSTPPPKALKGGLRGDNFVVPLTQ